MMERDNNATFTLMRKNYLNRKKLYFKLKNLLKKIVIKIMEKTVNLCIRLKKKDFRKLKKICKEKKVLRSEYVREAIFDKMTKEKE